MVEKEIKQLMTYLDRQFNNMHDRFNKLDAGLNKVNIRLDKMLEDVDEIEDKTKINSEIHEMLNQIITNTATK